MFVADVESRLTVSDPVFDPFLLLARYVPNVAKEEYMRSV